MASIALGFMWLFGGALATLACSGLAVGTGRFVIATGAIGTGLGFIIRGLLLARRS